MTLTEGQSQRNMVQEILLKDKALSSEFKTRFLLSFTKQLILNSAPMEVLKLKEIVSNEPLKQEIEKEEIKERVQEVLKTEDEYEKSNFPVKEDELIEKKWAKPKIKKKSFPFGSFRNIRLTIPEPNLPERLKYLKPTPVPVEMDLDKLNPLMKDSHVRTIECSGPDTNVLVTGTMGEKKTNIVLNENEINDIINRFAVASKIPVSEGVYKVAVGRMIFMAIVSEVIGSKFIIKKMIAYR